MSLENIEGEVPKVGDMLDVIGAHQTPDDLAKNVIGGTIDYEILTSLGAKPTNIPVFYDFEQNQS